MAQFAIAGLLGSAQIIVSERRSRCLQRLRTTAISHFQILLGHFLAMFVLILVQIVILIAFGQFFLKLNYLGQPLAVLIMALALALFVAGLGLLIGALARTEDQAVIFALKKLKSLYGGDAISKARVEVRMDSELAVKQLSDQYKINEDHIGKLYIAVRNLKLDFGEVVFKHVPRESNREADRLVNEALDEREKPALAL